MRRILIFSLVYYPRFVGGAEVAVKEITDRVSKDEIEFDMVTLRKQAPAFERIGNINVYRVGTPWHGSNTKSSRIFPLSKILFPYLAFKKAVELQKSKPYDAVWSIMASYGGFAAAKFKKRFPKVPLILTIQEGDNFGRRDGIFKPLFRKIFKAADKVQVISNFLADWSKKMGATAPIVVVPNAVDFQPFSKPISEEQSLSLKNKLNKKEGDYFLITTSRLVPKNGIGDIIESLKFLTPNIKLLILGTGVLDSNLQSLVSNLGLVDRVQFLGFIAHSEMPKYLQISDIFIRPSLSEGFGNSFIEAMAAGIPVIATPVGGIVDFLQDGETGLFCEVRNPKSIAQKVEKFIKDKESREYIVRQAKKMVEEKYQWGRIAGEMKEILVE